MTRLVPRATHIVLGVAWLACAAAATRAEAQSAAHWGRVSFNAQGATTSQTGGATGSFGEIVSSITFQSPTTDAAATGFGLDLRVSGYPMTEDRSARTSVYEAYVARRVGGHLVVKAGQLFIADLGALGAVGGVLVESRGPKTAAGQLRFGAFGGWEPQIMKAGWLNDVRKIGGYLAIDTDGARRHVVGFVHVADQGTTERAVISTTNYLAYKSRLFVYQAAEIDLVGPAGQGHGGLTYFFANVRGAFSETIELQGTMHRGRSVDTRTIVDQWLQGRPIEQRSLDGLVYESYNGRLTVRPVKALRVYAGYGIDRNNRDDESAGRLLLGAFASNVFRSGVDVTVTDNRMQRGTMSYDSWYVSVGRSVGSKAYLTGEYSTYLSTLHVTNPSDFTIESRPRTNRIGVSGLFNVTRRVSLVTTIERTKDGTSTETRAFGGFTLRF